MTTLAVIGAGKLGVVLAQLALQAGFDVRVSGSGDPSKIALTMSVLAPGSTVGRTEEIVPGADAVVLALPLSKVDSLPADILRDSLVIDAMNYWWEVDGRDLDAQALQPSSSEAVRQRLGLRRLVKALNHIGYHDLADATHPEHPQRLGIAVAGDDPDDVETVATIVRRLGFDPVTLPSLHAGTVLEPGHPGFGAALPEAELRGLLTA